MQYLCRESTGVRTFPLAQKRTSIPLYPGILEIPFRRGKSLKVVQKNKSFQREKIEMYKASYFAAMARDLNIVVPNFV